MHAVAGDVVAALALGVLRRARTGTHGCASDADAGQARNVPCGSNVFLSAACRAGAGVSPSTIVAVGPMRRTCQPGGKRCVQALKVAASAEGVLNHVVPTPNKPT